MAKIKQLVEKEQVFYPVTVGQAVIFEDETNAEITEPQMDQIFGWSRNYIEFTSIDNDNYITATVSAVDSEIEQPEK